jgi:hypothetical protein
MTFANFLSIDIRRMSRAGVRRKIRSMSSMGSLSININDRGSEAGVALGSAPSTVVELVSAAAEVDLERELGRIDRTDDLASLLMPMDQGL